MIQQAACIQKHSSLRVSVFIVFFLIFSSLICCFTRKSPEELCVLIFFFVFTCYMWSNNGRGKMGIFIYVIRSKYHDMVFAHSKDDTPLSRQGDLDG